MPSPPPPPIPSDGDGEFLFTFSGTRRRRDDEPGPNPWDKLNAWLVAANERQVDRRRVARLLGIDASDAEVMRLAARIPRRRRQ